MRFSRAKRQKNFFVLCDFKNFWEINFEKIFKKFGFTKIYIFEKYKHLYLSKIFYFLQIFVTFINFQKTDFLRFSRAKPHVKIFCHKSWLLKKVGHFLDFLQKIGARVRFSDFFLSKCVIIVFTSGKKVAKKYILGVPKLRFFAFFPGQTTKNFFVKLKNWSFM